jgi:hypothetical protein
MQFNAMQRNAIRRDVRNVTQCSATAMQMNAMQRNVVQYSGTMFNKNNIQHPTPVPMLVLVTMKVPFRGISV